MLMALRIIGAGLGRTGTASLKVALETLGAGPCYHMSEVLAHPDHVALWIDVAGGRPDFDRIFDGYAATVDFPSAIYWRALMDHYPDAKVILSHRDPEAWYRSTQETILGRKWWEFALNGPFGAMCAATIEPFLGGDVHDHDRLIEIFTAHVATVRATVPPDRLLVFQAKDGWEPLCAFLGVPVPETPYPHVNSEAETKRLFEEIIRSMSSAEVGAKVSDTANEAFSARPA
jgi:hypothetical protein